MPRSEAMTINNQMVLVTGANGFLGGALCKALSDKMSVRKAVRQASTRGLIAGSAEVNGELSDTFDWSSALSGVTTVVHCAARVHVFRETAEDPLKEFRAINVHGTMNLALQAVKSAVRRFIFVSSIGVSGGETHANPFLVSGAYAPHTPYAVSKFEAEVALRTLAEETGLEVVIIRPPLIYGPNAPGNFASLLKFLENGIPLPLGSVVHNRRSFVYIDNMVDLIVTCISHSNAANQTFQVSDGESLSTVALLRLMGEALGKPARLFPVPVAMLKLAAWLLGKPGVAQRLCSSLEVDIGMTRELLGWEPPISVDDGLRRTAEHWKALQQASRG
jgi:nucleoside-diphosphate-sugar epimerase